MLIQSFHRRFWIKNVQLICSNYFRQIFCQTRFGANLLTNSFWTKSFDQIFWLQLLDQLIKSFFYLCHPVFWPTLLNKKCAIILLKLFSPNLLTNSFWTKSFDQIFWPQLLDQIFWSNPVLKILLTQSFDRRVSKSKIFVQLDTGKVAGGI